MNVAAYVASVAGKPAQAAGPQWNDPKSIFTASCGSCHTLEDAGTTGVTGPNLDDSQPSRDEAVEQIGRLDEYMVKATAG